MGESGGDFSDNTFSCDVSDLSQAPDCLRNGYSAPAVLIGHSLRGAATLEAVGLVTYTSGGPGERTVALQGPYATRKDFLTGTSVLGAATLFPADDVLGWTATAAFPLLPDAALLPVFAQMRSGP